MAEPLRNLDGQVNELARIEPVPPALPEAPRGDLHQRPLVIESGVAGATERTGNAAEEAIGNSRLGGLCDLRVVAGRSREAGDAVGDMTDGQQGRARGLSEEAAIRMDEFRWTTRRRMQQARAASRKAVSEHPLESLLAIGGMALMVGFLLRIWRSNGD